MAPEQMRSDAVVDARSDVWALGATLFALVTGEPPFGKGTVLEIHERIQRGAPSLRQRAPEAPEALEQIVLRCLEADPAARFSGRRPARGGPRRPRAGGGAHLGPARGPDPRRRADRPARRHRGGARRGRRSAPPSPGAPTAPVEDASWVDGAKEEPAPPDEPVVTEAPPRPPAAWPRGLAIAGLRRRDLRDRRRRRDPGPAQRPGHGGARVAASAEARTAEASLPVSAPVPAPLPEALPPPPAPRRGSRSGSASVLLGFRARAPVAVSADPQGAPS